MTCLNPGLSVNNSAYVYWLEADGTGWGRLYHDSDRVRLTDHDLAELEVMTRVATK